MRAEDEGDFEEFVRARWPRLLRTAYLLTGDRHHAEDVVQAALAKAYRFWPRVRRTDNADAYVKRVLINCNNDRFRKRRIVEQLTDTPPDEASFQDPLSGSEERGSLMAALATLPPRQRAVVVLRYWDDLPEAEVAEVLGCAVGTVKSHAAQGLARLRRHPGLAERMDEEVGR